MIKPIRAVQDRIREVVFAQRCVDPRIVVRGERRPSSDVPPGQAGHGTGPALTVSLLVKSVGTPLLGGRQEMEYVLQDRLGLPMFVEFEDVWLERAQRDDVVAVVPL